MDTKSRNIKYSLAMKIVAVFLIWVSFSGVFAGLVFQFKYADEIARDNYFETYRFSGEFRRCVDNVIASAVVQDMAGGVSGIAAIDGYNINGSPYIDEASGIMTNITEEYEDTARYVPSTLNFMYLVRNTQSGATVTNLKLSDELALKAAEDFKKNKAYLFYSAKDKSLLVNGLWYTYTDNLRRELQEAPIELYATVEDELKPGDVFYDIQEAYKKIQGRMPIFLIGVITAFILSIGSFIYLAAVTGRSKKEGEVKPSPVDWLYTDVHTAIAAFVAILSIEAVHWMNNVFSDELSNGISLFTLFSIDLMIALNYIMSMIRHIKRSTQFKHTLIFVLFKAAAHILAQCFGSKTIKPATVLLLLAYGGLDAMLFALATHTYGSRFWIIMLMILLLNIGAIYYVSRSLTSLSGIMKWVKEMTKGNLEYALGVENMSLAFATFVTDIGSLQTGIKQAVTEAVKGERLKTELITNVSHDLKTPLTSIINYVDLLKKENFDNKTINEYIGILENKSARLKQLVDDLLEASRAASGDMTVNYSSVDLCSLVEQAVAEYSEIAIEAVLDMRIKMCEKPVVVRGDGTLMWRIMDNLLSNVVKYSQKNSRVYIDIEDIGSTGVITVKNMSEAALDISSDQLLERFVRGDRSRSTEGSGLGLSIAKSLAVIQGGTLELKIDGDLFKVIVSLPIEIV